MATKKNNKTIKPIQPKTKPVKPENRKSKRADADSTASKHEAASAKLAGEANKRSADTEADTKARLERLPPPGTVIQKKDRHGEVRAECTVMKDGSISYKGKVHRSLSGAAVAAAEDLGLTSRSHNGFIFWGLMAPPRVQKDPLTRLAASFERYVVRAAEAIKSEREPSKRTALIAGIKKHVEQHEKLLG